MTDFVIAIGATVALASLTVGRVEIIFTINLYRVTIPLLQNLPLTSKQTFRFGLELMF